jgi:DHA2 family multidrug resistance protein-like MFS transporter
MEAGAMLIPASVAMIFGAPFSTLLAKRFGPRVNVVVMTAAMVIGMVMLTQLTVASGSLLPIAALFVFGFGAGLGMPALTDTIMAAVPERDAGVASAVNDVSREFGGALGIATVGSLVAGLYRANVTDSLPSGLPAEVGELIAEGIGVAAVVAQGLPAELAAVVTDTANTAFMQAMNDGFVISAVVLLSSVVIAFTLIPTRMREAQAEFDESGFEPTGDDAPGLEPEPEGGTAEPVPELTPEASPEGA